MDLFFKVNENEVTWSVKKERKEKDKKYVNLYLGLCMPCHSLRRILGAVFMWA